jgi:RNA polymerase sigma-70 factor (ECF subfamily)
MNATQESSVLSGWLPASPAVPDEERTSGTLLDRVRDWRDEPAWAEFHDRYDPLLHRWCARFAFDADTADELCQRIWVELMARMRTFRYDPGGGFRKWLWRLFWSRAVDLLRHRRATRGHFYQELPSSLSDRRRLDREPPEGDQARAPALVLEAEKAQAAVRARVEAETWDAYWIVAIEDRPIREAADRLGKTYTAIYTGYKRVDRMLRAEGQRRLAALLSAGG